MPDIPSDAEIEAVVRKVLDPKTAETLLKIPDPDIRRALEMHVLASKEQEYRIKMDANVHHPDIPASMMKDANLSGRNLSGMDLSGLRLDGVNLEGANLRNAKLNGTSFAGAEMARADLSGASLRGSNLTGASLDSTKFVGADFSPLHAGEGGSSLLFGVHADGADFSNAKLRETKFYPQSAKGTRFVGTDFTGAELQGGDFTESTVERAILKDALVEHTEFTPKQVATSVDPPPALAAKAREYNLVQEMRAEVSEFKARAGTVGADGTTTIKSPGPKGGELDLHIPPKDFIQPALDFEKKYGVKGVGRKYNLPDGMTPQEVESYAKTVWHKKLRGEITAGEMEQKMQRLRATLEDLNPELKKLTVGAREMGTYELIFGATSGFNPKDIQSFLDGNDGHAMKVNPRWKEFEADLSKRGMKAEWLPSAETMDEIQKQVSHPSYRPPVAAPAAAEAAAATEATSTAGRTAETASTAGRTAETATTAGRTAEATTAAGRTAEAVTATQDANKASRLQRLLKPSESQYTWRIARAIGVSEKNAGRLATTTKAGGLALKILGPVAGGIMTYDAVKENANGNSYTALLDASGLPAESSVRDSYDNYQKKNIVDNVALTIPAGVTQAYWGMSTLVRWAVGDVDHRKLLANIVVRANSGTEEAKTREAVRQYVDSGLTWFHYLSHEKQKNVLDNIMAMEKSGKMQDWSQLPGLVGTPGNMTLLQQSPDYFMKNSADAVKLPDVNKTNPALYGTDEKNADGSPKNLGLSAEIAEAAQIENMRKRSQIPDIDWEQAREKFQQGGKDAMMNYLSGQMPANMWENTKQFFAHALDVFDADKDVEALRNLWNRPLDTLTGAFVGFVNGAKDGDDLSRPVVLDDKGNPRLLTPELMEEIKSKQPAEGADTTGFRYLHVEKRNGQNVVVATDMTKEDLDKLQSGQMKLASASEMMGGVKPGGGQVASVDDLRAKAQEIAKEADAAKKEKLQEEFNSMFGASAASTQKAFVSGQKSLEESKAVDGYLESVKAAGGAGGGGLDALEALHEQYRLKEYSTRIANNQTFEIGGKFYTAHQAEMPVIDTNNDQRVDGADKRFKVQLVESENGVSVVNVGFERNKQVGLYIPVDPETGKPVPAADPEILKRMREETAKKNAEEKAAEAADKKAAETKKATTPSPRP